MKDKANTHFDATFPSFVRRARKAEPAATTGSSVSTPSGKEKDEIATRQRLAEEFFRRAFGGPDDQLWL